MRGALALCLLVGCPENTPATSVLVRLGAEDALRSEIVAVQIEVSGDRVGGGDPTEDLDTRIQVRDGRWPLGTLIAPRGNEMGRRFFYRATALGADDVTRGRIELAAAFVDGEAIVIDLELTAACAMMICDESCEAVAGVSQCVDAMRDLARSDAGPSDAGRDTGDVSTDDGGDAPDADADVPGTVRLRAPENGAYTGVGDAADRPTFRWEQLDEAAEYRIQLFACDTLSLARCTMLPPVVEDRTSETSWSPSVSLAVSVEPPVGTRFLWRVAGCDTIGAEVCEPWSETRYLNVGRLRGDFNGDGLGDVAIGDDQADNADPEVVRVGSVTLYYGREPRNGDSDGALLPRTLSTNTRFGTALAAGDFDGDGFADLAVSSEEGTTVHRGTMDGLQAGGIEILGLRGRGAALASLGDVNADGFDDFVVAGEGAQVAVLLGGTDLGSREPVLLEPGAGPHVPHALGDIDGDGLVDLLVGQPESVRGQLVLYRSGSRSSLLDSPPLTLEHPDATSLFSMGSEFGFAAAGGDFDGDGFADVAVGAPGWMDGAGRVYLTHGSREGLVGAWRWRDPTVGRAGHAVRVADLGRTGFADLLVGSPAEMRDSPEQGGVYVYTNVEGELPDTGVGIPSPVTARLEFGHAIGLADYDTDSEIELFIAAPGLRRVYRYEIPTATERVIMLPAVMPPVRHGASVAP